jgi:acyl-CoA thioester hydrolase
MLSGFRFRHPVEVRFRDLDAVGHVNNAVYLTYLESARLGWWQKVTGRAGIEGLDIILARTEIDYRSPVSLGERLEVGVRCTVIKRSSFTLDSEIIEPESGRLVAQARNVIVYFDYATGRTAPIPPELRRQILAQDPDAVEEET